MELAEDGFLLPRDLSGMLLQAGEFWDFALMGSGSFN
jgi:hypothetical protein